MVRGALQVAMPTSCGCSLKRTEKNTIIRPKLVKPGVTSVGAGADQVVELVGGVERVYFGKHQALC